MTVASAENRTHLDYRITKGAVKLSEKPKVSINDKVAGKKDNGLVSSKRSTPKIAKDISSNNVYSNRQNTDRRPNATVLRTSLVRASSVTTSPISIVSQVKAISTSKGSVDKLPTKLPLHERSTQVDYHGCIHIEFYSSADGFSCWLRATIYAEHYKGGFCYW